MKLLITSDIHKNIEKLKMVLQKHPDITLHLDAGDSQLAVELLDELNILSVKGNTDFLSRLPLERLENFDGKNIYITHGHKLNVKRSYKELEQKAKREQVDICISGHTHVLVINTIGNILFLNPGSLGYDDTYIIYENNKARAYKLYE